MEFFYRCCNKLAQLSIHDMCMHNLLNMTQLIKSFEWDRVTPALCNCEWIDNTQTWDFPIHLQWSQVTLDDQWTKLIHFCVSFLFF